MSQPKGRACKLKTLIDSEQSQQNKLIKKRIHEILLKDERKCTKEENLLLKEHKSISNSIRYHMRYQMKKKEREEEQEDDLVTLRKKCSQLADLIRSNNNIVLYTGAGISTSASIPDYRGPNGVWTQIKNGLNAPEVGDLVLAEPTYTHMAISELVKLGIAQHVVSQNCDGLHLRSGLPSSSISEVHGNMYIEVCQNCNTSYLRSFDVTEKTSLRKHKTGRLCHNCPPEVGHLVDTIVHFGEKGKFKYPFNWEGAVQAAENADLIICIGSSLKILRKYACFWPKNNKKRYELAIINLQWTPKDSQATIKLNGRCDLIMEEIMTKLGIPVPSYERSLDPLYTQSVTLQEEEQSTCNRIKLEDLYDNQIDESKIHLTPAWFGKGIKRK